MEANPQFLEIFDFFKNAFSINVNDYVSFTTDLILPIIPYSTMIKLIDEFTKTIKDEPIVMKFFTSKSKTNNDENEDKPIIIIGDIHGHILDMLRVFHKFSDIENYRFLFLGDIVDRGPFSTETIAFIMVAKVLYPKNIFIIRGNHEFIEVFNNCGFTSEISKLYKNSHEVSNLIYSFKDSFSYLPLAAIINNEICCMHGGIGPNLIYVEALSTLNKPINNFQNKTVDDCLWSDPDEILIFFGNSSRGSGHKFGKNALIQFLSNSELKMLVRGHQCIHNGVEFKFDNKLATVFTASNYCGVSSNQSGILIVNRDRSLSVASFEPLMFFVRELAIFKELIAEPPVQLPMLNSQKHSTNNNTTLHSNSSASFYNITSGIIKKNHQGIPTSKSGRPGLFLGVKKNMFASFDRNPFASKC